MADSIKIASICMNSRDNKSANIKKASELISRSVDQGAEWVMLPEMFTYFGNYEDLFDNADEQGGATFQELSRLAARSKICLFAGSLAERPDIKEGKKVYNTAYVFGRDGSMLAKYRKTHLFIFSDPANKYSEPDGFLAGNSIEVLEIEGFTVGLAICFDLRFPGFFTEMSRSKQIDVLAIPSAFTLRTGMAHWELLLRARAVELQSYVFAANQTGDHGNGKASFGHSMIINSWGEKLADSGKEEGVILSSISKEHLLKVRGSLPLRQCRRLNLYR